MRQREPVTIDLDNGCRVLMDPETLFWVIAKPDEVQDCRRHFDKMYTKRVQEDLAIGMNHIRSRVAVELLELHPTSSCNMACSYCYVPEETRETQHVMSIQDMVTVLTKFFDHIHSCGGAQRVILHGGEPCLVKDSVFTLIDEFPAITGGRYESDVRFAIQTNGTLLTHEDIEFIKDRDINISLSLDGPTAQVNDLTRLDREGNSTFVRVRKAIEMLRGHEKCGVIVTITKHNVKFLDRTLRVLDSWGVRSTIFNPVSTSAPMAHELVPQVDTLIDEYKKLVDTLLETNRKRDPNQRLVVDNIESIVVSLLCSNQRILYCHMSPCGAGRFVWVVAADGTVYPDAEFMGFEEFACGNALHDSVSDIVNSPAARKLRKRHVSTIDACRQCALREICGANCPASVYGKYRTLQGKAVYCEFFKAIIKYIFTKIGEHGHDAVYNLVGADSEMRIRNARRISWAGE